jgi:chromosome segregation ATPase
MSFVPSPIRINTEYALEQDTEEMEKLRGKIKNLERNDRTNVQTLRETKEEADRKRNRINQLELAKSELEEIVRIRDEKIRKFEKNIKDMQEQTE